MVIQAINMFVHGFPRNNPNLLLLGIHHHAQLYVYIHMILYIIIISIIITIIIIIPHLPGEGC